MIFFASASPMPGSVISCALLALLMSTGLPIVAVALAGVGAGVAAPAARLTDLTSEVGGLTVAEFRRLGKDAQQAADRIRQKFEALKSESFERWTDGVQAWRSSPLQQTYLKLIAESFSSGTPVAQLAEQKRGKDAEALSAEELGAIIDLNRDIHL